MYTNIKKEMKIERNKSLKLNNTMGLDVAADFLAQPQSLQEVSELIENKDYKLLPKIVIGYGSNLLFVADFKGLVIRPQIMDIEIVKEDGDFVYVKAGAGIIWDDFVRWCVNRNWGGVENLSWIPGSIGAAPVQNVGAYGAEAADTIHEVHFYHLNEGTYTKLDNRSCHFGYRDSVFKNRLKSAVIITHVIFRLSKKPVVNTSYADLKEELTGMACPDITDIRAAVINIRKKKLPDPAEIGNCGSFFKNPVVPKSVAMELKERYPLLRLYPSESGDSFKVPAAWLIEQCGFKGQRYGNTGVHPNQALVIVAYEGATGEEILQLAEKIKRSVKDRFSIDIEPEVNIIASS